MLPFVGVPPQKMLGFVRLFSPFSGAALRPPKRSCPPLQYRFEAFFSLLRPWFDPPKAVFQTRPLQDDISNVKNRTPQAPRDNPSRFRALNLGEQPPSKTRFSSRFIHASFVRQSFNPRGFSRRHSRSLVVTGYNPNGSAMQ